jgi:hypothetical protein
MLAAAIFAKPDVLLLDEPTNHLSILAVMWLARELATSDTWKERIVVLVSHDRHFMDEVCTDCLHVSGVARKLTQSRGNYSLWARRRRDEQVLYEKQQAKRKEEIDRLREYAGHGFKYGGSSSQINKMSMKTKQADKLEREHVEQATEAAALQEDIELWVLVFISISTKFSCWKPPILFLSSHIVVILCFMFVPNTKLMVEMKIKSQTTQNLGGRRNRRKRCPAERRRLWIPGSYSGKAVPQLRVRDHLKVPHRPSGREW